MVVKDGKITTVGSDTKIDVVRIGLYHSDKSGVTTMMHEIVHSEAIHSGGDVKAGDLPSSQAGPAEKEGQRVAAEAPDISKADAEGILDKLVETKEVTFEH